MININKLRKYGSLVETHPILIEEWDYQLNTLSPTEITYHYSKKIHWICKKGHEFSTPPNIRVRLGNGCPICAKEGGTSFPEQSIFYYLNSVIKCENRYNIDGYEIDIYIPSLSIGIEYDGNYFHNSKLSRIREEKKNIFLANKGIRLIRIKESNEDKIINDIIYFTPTKEYEFVKGIIDCITKKIGIEAEITVDPNRDRIAILEQYLVREKKNSITTKFPKVAEEWDYERNGRIKPEYIKASSNHKFWWKCKKGHSWLAAVYSRANGNGCPCCSGKVLVKGENDLLSQNSKLSKEWNTLKNGIITPETITIKNGRKVWWKCSKCNHEWKASIAHRSDGEGCPICGRIKSEISRIKHYLNKNGSFVDIKPSLLEEWDYVKNENLDPYSITPNSGRKVWWICRNCNHNWEATIYNRTKKNSGCPICKKNLLSSATINTALNKTGSIAKTHPHLLEEWDYNKNIISPQSISIGSHRKVWWTCRLCGYNWESAPCSSNRIKGFQKGCPACQRKIVWKGHNDLSTTNPLLALQWNYKRNIELDPTDITDGSNRKVWWICSNCGFEWEAQINNRNTGKGLCPHCKKHY